MGLAAKQVTSGQFPGARLNLGNTLSGATTINVSKLLAAYTQINSYAPTNAQNYSDIDTAIDSAASDNTQQTAFTTAAGVFVDASGAYGVGGGSLPATGAQVTQLGSPGSVTLRDSTTLQPIQSATGNDVYGILFYDTDDSKYYIKFFSDESGVQTAHTTTGSPTIDLQFGEIFSFENFPNQALLGLPGNFVDISIGDITGVTAGNGMTGGGASGTVTVTVLADSTTGGDVVPVSVGANGVGLDVSSIDGTGIEADGSGALRLATQGTGIAGGGGTTLSFDATAVDGNGLSGSGSTLTVDSDTETGGNIQGVNVTANGVGVDINAIAGTGLEADGTANLRVDTGSTVNFSADTPVWTFGNETTGEGLFVTGTPVDATHAVNKNYVDNAITGLAWKDPVNAANLLGNIDVIGLVGNAAASVIEGLSPAAGDAYVVTTADGSGVLSTAIVGDIWQYVGSVWTKIVTGSGGFVPNGTYVLLSESTALISPYTDVTDDGKRGSFDGTSTTATLTTPTAGDAYVIDGSGATDVGSLYEYSGTAWVQLEAGSGGFVANGVRAILGLTSSVTLISPYTEASDDTKVVEFDGTTNTGANTSEAADANSLLVQDTNHVGVYDNLGYVYEGTVPTGSWIQFTGAGQINAGAGLDKTGNTLFIGDVNKGIQVNADDLEIDGSEIAGDGLEEDGTFSYQLNVKADSTTGGDTVAVAVSANGVGLLLTTIDGDGITTSGAGELQVQNNGDSIAVGASGIKAAQPAHADKGKNTSGTITGANQDTGLTVAGTPNGDGYFMITVNGIEEEVGETTAAKFYFRDAGNTTTRTFETIVSTDKLFTNAGSGQVLGYDIEAADEISFHYNTNTF